MPKKAASKKQSEAEATEAPEPKPARKVVFSSDSARYGQPPAFAQVGLKKISLPSPEKQLAGFEHEDARLLVRAVPGFKWQQAKGSQN